MDRITPNLIVESIEDCLGFWIDRLGFEKITEVPEGDDLGFVILKRGDIELMLQSRASLQKDVEPLAGANYLSVVYVQVGWLDSVRQGLEGWPRVVPERTTFYGAREIIVKDPAGNVVFLAQHR